MVTSIQGGVTPQGPPAKDYFVMSILTIFCCFMPLGLVALIKSIEVSITFFTLLTMETIKIDARNGVIYVEKCIQDSLKLNQLKLWLTFSLFHLSLGVSLLQSIY